MYNTGTESYYAQETAFNYDFDGNGSIGTPAGVDVNKYTRIEYDGTLTLLKDSAGKLFLNWDEDADDDFTAVTTSSGEAMTVDHWSGWIARAAELNEIAFVNQGDNDRRLRIVAVSDSGVVSDDFSTYTPHTEDYYNIEWAYKYDFDGDGYRGKPDDEQPWAIVGFPEHRTPLINNQWHLYGSDRNGANVINAWHGNNDGRLYFGYNVHISIIDDGLQHEHEEIGGGYGSYLGWASYDYVDGDGDPTPPSGSGHGTSAAGVAAGDGFNDKGITGAAPYADLSGQRLLGAGTPANETAALSKEINRIDIYNNSWGPSDNGTIQPAPVEVLRALKNGSENGRSGKGNIFTWAGGNGRTNKDNSNYDGYANSRYVISVAAVSDAGTYSSYSEPGANVLVTAPSDGGTHGITTTDIMGAGGYNDGSSSTNYSDSNYTNDFGGTSSATPLVSGIVALMLEANSYLRWRDVQHILVRTSDVVDSTNSGWFTNGAGRMFNHNYGFGRINAAEAVRLAKTWTNANVAAEVSHYQESANTVAIPDSGKGSLDVTISVTNDVTIETVEIPISSDHTYRGDLTIELTSPAGTKAILSEGGRNDSGLLIFTFSAKPFWGESSLGDWTLKITDEVSGNSGSLNSWGLNFHGTAGTNWTKQSTEIVKSKADSLTGDSGLTYASADALTNVDGLTSYINFVEETLADAPERATGNWIIGVLNTTRRSLTDVGFDDITRITKFKEESRDIIRVFDVSPSVEDLAFISDSLNKMGDELAYAYPELLHDTTTRSGLPDMLA